MPGIHKFALQYSDNPGSLKNFRIKPHGKD